MGTGQAITHAQMDQIVNEDFGFEATDDIDGVMGSLTETAEHEVIPSPVRALSGQTKIRAYYEMLFEGVTGEDVTPVRRLYGDDFIIDEAIWHGRVEDGRAFLLDGESGPVSFRLLHVFDIEDGKIRKEQVCATLPRFSSNSAAR